MQPIIDFFSHFFDYILDALSSCFKWLLDLLADSFDSLLSPLASALPDLSSYWADLSELSPYFAVVNSFFPLYECGFFIAAYFAFIVVFLTAKYIIKIFVPFVG